ncbi:ATP-binding cassette domain-containing protein [Nakamurella sp. YIM 132087]|uniref:ATP-binding cassette domain-containing protein n=1 Tax=Nakamurella alba TaxID=2665158 RepID=A0A7K1FGG3_9ACTN|nr:ABC transporter ATP-binding protein [Nakamurella alba]MTD13215.1 ATP-binding cassette domain-containing protein [Nakamurella alba]
MPEHVPADAALSTVAPSVTSEPHVQLRGLSKNYGTLRANDAIDLSVRKGEIHVLVGENGAGKSTLMGMLSGTVRPDAGQVVIAGEDVTGFDARQAIAAGVGMVHQHFRLVGAFTVAENIALGAEPVNRRGMLDRDAARAKAREVSVRFGLSLDADAVVEDMSVGMQQRVEIVKTLTRDAEILIFDEPTAVLTDEESASLFEVLRRLRDDGRAIIFITHKLREALALADTVSVLRRGRLVATRDPAATTVEELGTLMVGRQVVGTRREPTVIPDDAAVLLEIDDVSMGSRTLHGMPLRELSMQVRAGEVLGILGVDGNGQHEIVSVLTGLESPDTGTVRLSGTDMTGRGGRAFLEAGLGVIPADRHHEGLVLSMPISRNLVLDRRNDPRFVGRGGFFLRTKAIRENARAMIEKYDIRTQSAEQPASSLSGGNQQKVVIAREMERDISVMIAANPVRGLDVGSIEFVHRRLLELAGSGAAVVVVTSDIDEAMAVSDRIGVVVGGRFTGFVQAPFDRDVIGMLMGGEK